MGPEQSEHCNCVRHELKIMTAINFANIRAVPTGPRDAFEDLACLVFKKTTEVPDSTSYTRVRGTGGDGGVEAYLTLPTGQKIGIQAKYFFKLGTSELGQIKGSFNAAMLNHPTLTEFHIYIPFDLTDIVAGGKRGKGEVERFQEWRRSTEDEWRRNGHEVRIILVPAADLSQKILEIDTTGGLRRYWFDATVVSTSSITHALEISEALAGPRYTATLDVSTEAHDMLDVFSGIERIEAWLRENYVPLIAQVSSQIEDSRADTVFSCLGDTEADKLISSLTRIASQLRALHKKPDDPTLPAEIRSGIEAVMPSLETVESHHLEKFRKAHGDNADSITFRQFHAEYMATFPAAELDFVRDVTKTLAGVLNLLAAPMFLANSASTMLMVGPAGIGKTHSLVSMAKRRLANGALTLVLFGDEFDTERPWEIIANRLSIAGPISRDTLYGALQAAAEHSGFPFLIVIDALNESPNLTKWKNQLKGLIAELKPYPLIKLVISTRDSFKSFIVDAEFPGYAFENNGFAGRELIAMQAFCAFYGLTAEITPLFADELTNPLFLQLACKAIKESGGLQLDLALPGFVRLIEDYFKVCDRELREKHGYANPSNLVRNSLLSIVNACHQQNRTSVTWDEANSAVAGALANEIQSQAFLQGLRSQGLVIIAPDPKAHDQDTYIVRIGFQRYSDVLLAMAIASAAEAVGRVNPSRLTAALDALDVQGDLGILESLACVLPERYQLELPDIPTELPEVALYRAFLSSLPWRSRESISVATEKTIDAALNLGLWREVFNALLKISLVPQHRLNARFLSRVLARQPLIHRDPFLAQVLHDSLENTGVVESILQCAGTADTTRWPADSVALIGIVLSWMSSAPDRRIRDRATKALTLTISKHPEIAANLLYQMARHNDEYIVESIVLAIYGAQLISKHTSPFMSALRVMLSPALSTPNIIIRDAVKMLAANIEATADDELAKQIAMYPEKSELPDEWPSLNTINDFVSNQDIPSNLKMRPTGMYTDFSQYVVRGAVEKFDLEKAGISWENILCWFMQRLVILGYGIESTNSLAYDYGMIRKFGNGRGKPAFAETLGKKYYWIALHQLIGLLSDNLDRKTNKYWSEPTIKYLSQDFRKLDVTDLREFSAPPPYPTELLSDYRYPFTRMPEDDNAWIKLREDISTPEDCIICADKDGTRWVLLEFNATDSEKNELDFEGESYRKVALTHNAMLLPKDISLSILQRERAIDSVFETQSDRDYRLFAAEYPDSEMIRSRINEGSFYVGYESEHLPFEFAVIELLRGSEWEYDSSARDDVGALHFPAPSIATHLGLNWDGHHGWIDNDGLLTAVYLANENLEAFCIREDALKSYLASTNKQLIYRQFCWKLRAGNYENGTQSDRFTYLRYDGSILRLFEEYSSYP